MKDRFVSRAVSFFLFLAFLPGCAAGKEFSRFARPGNQTAGLYLIRPTDPVLSLQRMDVDIFSYPGHFRDGNASLIRSLSLATGEYIYLELPEGFYRFHLKNRDEDERILKLNSGDLTFLSIEIFNTSYFALPSVRLHGMDRSQAAEVLIAPAGRMHAHRESLDLQEK